MFCYWYICELPKLKHTYGEFQNSYLQLVPIQILWTGCWLRWLNVPVMTVLNWCLSVEWSRQASKDPAICRCIQVCFPRTEIRCHLSCSRGLWKRWLFCCCILPPEMIEISIWPDKTSIKSYSQRKINLSQHIHYFFL